MDSRINSAPARRKELRPAVRRPSGPVPSRSRRSSRSRWGDRRDFGQGILTMRATGRWPLDTRIRAGVDDPIERRPWRGQSCGYRSRHDQLRHCRLGIRRGGGHPERGRTTHHSFRRGVHRVRRAACRSTSPAAGDPEPQRHDLLREAIHRPAFRRDQWRDQGCRVRRGVRPERGREVRGTRYEVRGTR
jgi:hypothetical protein